MKLNKKKQKQATKQRKAKVLKIGTVIRFIKSDKYIHTCFNAFEKAVWDVEDMVHSQKFKSSRMDNFHIEAKHIFSVKVFKDALGEYFIIESRSKKIRGKKRKSKGWVGEE